MRLNSIPFAAPAKLRALLEDLGSEGLSASGDAGWAATSGLSVEVAARWRRQALAATPMEARRVRRWAAASNHGELATRPVGL